MAEQSKAVRKLIVITGASGWFGALNARALSRLGHTVYAGMRETKSHNDHRDRDGEV
jgi:NADP-dependent 3-hydroxy acid dehydrogenase YdfG